MTSPEMAAYLAKRLPDMATTNTPRRATPKHALPTKLDRAVAKKAADRVDDRKLAAWALAVKERDTWKDRKTGKRVKVKRTRDLDPLRAEAHHVTSREDEAVRYDVRNGITLAFETHDAVERNKLRIVGTKFFTKNGTRYIDATHPVRFVEVK